MRPPSYMKIAFDHISEEADEVVFHVTMYGAPSAFAGLIPLITFPCHDGWQ